MSNDSGQSSWLDLARRCESASGADQAVDDAITELVLGWRRAVLGGFGAAWRDGKGATRLHQNFTGSLDKALDLVPKRHDWTVRAAGRLYGATVVPEGAEDANDPIPCATAALALCAAALRARSAE